MALLGCALTGPAAANAEDAPAGRSKNTSFAVFGEAPGYITPESVCDMVCPAHRHGTPRQAYEKLTRDLRNRPADQLSSIWICRMNQEETLVRFLPLVDQIFINPFAYTSEEGPAEGQRIWPGFDHPVINNIRRIRSKAGRKRLIASVNLKGDPNLFHRRKPDFEEIRWMVYAVIGANFQGLGWRGNPSTVPWAERLSRLEDNLKRYQTDLGAARPVAWCKALDNQPISAIASDRTLFVVLLNPEYMRVVPHGKSPPLPLDGNAREVRIGLLPPPELTVEAARTLSGLPLLLAGHRNNPQVACRLTGAGKILVFSIRRHPHRRPERARQPIQPRTEPVEERKQ